MASLAASMDMESIRRYEENGISIGEHAYAGALRFFARGDLRNERHAEAIARRYFEAALLTATMAETLLAEHHFEIACFHHGIYVPQGLIGDACRREGVRVVNWNPAYRKGCFIFSHGDTYHHTLMEEPPEVWEDIGLTPSLDSQLDAYLKSRWYGTNDWIWYHEKPEVDVDKILAGLGVDLSRPIIGLLTNVVWDAQLHYPANAFESMVDWVLQTIRYFGSRQDLQLLVRIHPAEIRGTVRSRQPILEEIKSQIGHLPPNVVVIPPESRVSTYAAMERCDSVVIFGTKTGVELAAMGIPVVVAGEAWIRNKGLTIDAGTAEEYLRLLDRLPMNRRMPPEQVERARKYAYHFFFRRMIPLDVMLPHRGSPPYVLNLTDLKDLEPGRSPALDVVCDGILRNSDFIYPAEGEV